MKKIFNKTVLLVCIIMLSLQSQASAMVSADASAIIEVKSGKVIYESKGNQVKPPASLTKMLTAIVAAEYGNLTEQVTVSEKAARIPPSKLHFRPGEKILLNDLIKAALLRSANDACVAIAEHVGGSEEYFVYLMNLKAWTLCLESSNFVNTNGLPAKDHVSTAVEMAKIGVYCKRHPLIKDYVSKKEDVIIKRGREYKIGSTNKLLWSYEGANGIKTGTTNAAGKCLAASANLKGQEYVVVVLHSDNRYADSTKLLNYAFENFKTEKVVGKEDTFFLQIKNKKMPVGVSQDVFLALHKEEIYYKYIFSADIDNTITKGDKCGILALVTDDAILWYDIFAK